MNEGVQWYLSGATATDGVFAVNDTYRDTQLAYDFRGAMGVRACPAIEGKLEFGRRRQDRRARTSAAVRCF